jgi:hypothetical protein
MDSLEGRLAAIRRRESRRRVGRKLATDIPP